MSHLLLPAFAIGLTIAFVMWNSRRTSRAIERIRRGEPASIPVKVASKTGPYPRKLSHARLTRTAEGGVAFVQVAHTKQILLLAPPGLSLQRTTYEYDGTLRMPANESSLAYKCIDPAGNNVDVAARDSFMAAVVLLIDPQTPSPKQDLKEVAAALQPAGRRPRWAWLTPGMRWALLAPLLTLLLFAGLAAFSRPVDATVTSNNGDGNCDVTYTSVWSHDTLTDNISCPSDAKRGDTITVDEVAGLGVGDLSSWSGWSAYLAGVSVIVGLAFIPFLIVWWRAARARRAYRRASASGTADTLVRIDATSSSSPASPLMDSAPTTDDVVAWTYSTISAQIRERATKEDWRNERGTNPSKTRLVDRIAEWNSPWGLALIRASGMWFAALFLVVFPLWFAIPDFVDLRVVHAGPTKVATASVVPGSCNTLFFLVPPTFTATFATSSGTSSADITAISCPKTKTVEVQYAVNSPSHALLLEGDASGRMVIGASVLLVLGALLIGRRLRRSFGPALRMSKLVRERKAVRPYRYVITRTPDEIDTLLLFLPFGDDPPRWALQLIRRMSDRIPSDGYVEVIEGNMVGETRDLVPVFEGEVLWPTNPAVPGEWPDIDFLVNPTSKLTGMARKIREQSKDANDGTGEDH